jgi:hypothetical protein
MPLDARSTENCPLGHRCESCGAMGPNLGVTTHAVLNAMMCVTLCEGCRESGRPPSITLSTAQRLAEQHRGHLR